LDISAEAIDMGLVGLPPLQDDADILFLSCLQGDLEAIKKVVEGPMNGDAIQNIVNEQGNNLVLISVSKDKPDTLKYLLKLRACMDSWHDALHCTRSSRCAKLLIKHIIRQFLKAQEKGSGHFNLTALEKLEEEEKGDDGEEEKREGSHEQHRIRNRKWQTEIAKLVNITNNDGETPLHKVPHHPAALYV